MAPVHKWIIAGFLGVTVTVTTLWLLDIQPLEDTIRFIVVAFVLSLIVWGLMAARRIGKASKPSSRWNVWRATLGVLVLIATPFLALLVGVAGAFSTYAPGSGAGEKLVIVGSVIAVLIAGLLGGVALVRSARKTPPSPPPHLRE